LLFPSQIASYFVNAGGVVGSVATWITTWLSSGSWLYVTLYFLLTVGFTYFYTAFTFKPDETAQQLRKNGGVLPPPPPRPGARPGTPSRRWAPGSRWPAPSSWASSPRCHRSSR